MNKNRQSQNRLLIFLDFLVSTDSFVYGADTWEDRLTGLNDKTISYDEIGNPTSYLGANLSWRGRELVKYEKGNKQISYSYDVDGMRYRKVVKNNGVETAHYDYVYSDGRLILLTYTSNGASNTARFIYDSLGEIRGFILDNTQAYLYLKNGQGDITGIVDESGSIILTYSYTAWGKVTYSATAMESMALAATLSNVNPFTYRGYCYDYDIGMYYLQSRYYDPNICRFINADSTDYLGATGTTLSYNLFAYCENDGINYLDATGTWAYDVHAGYYKTTDFNKTESQGIKIKKFTKDKAKYLYDGREYLYIPYVKYEGKTCYYGTYYWAIESGINANYAKTIAVACNDVDMPVIGKTPAFPTKESLSWHFNVNRGTNLEDSRIVHAKEYIDKVIKELDHVSVLLKNGDFRTANRKRDSALKKLGTLLHPLQDIFAHTDEVSKFQKVNILRSKKYFSWYNGSYGLWYHETNKGIDSVSKHKSVVLVDVALVTCVIFEILVNKYPFLKQADWR